MVKKLKADALMIKEFLKKGYKQCAIARLLNIKKEKVSYWARHEMANNKVTSAMSSRKIANKINNLLINRNELDKNGKQLTIHYTTVNNYLKQHFGKPRKLRKVFYLSEEDKKKRLEFCKKILDKNFKPEQLFFTDESKIDLGSFTNDAILLDPQTKWDKNTYSLINRPKRKVEKCLIIAGGINYYGMSKLIFLDGTMNEFAYGQALLFYKDDIEEIEKKENIKLIFEQDGATSHTSKVNKFLLDKLFTEDGWIQNPPNSPDIAYPIEDIWGIIKPRVKRKEPKSIEELKQYLLEEWGSIPEEMTKNLCKGYLDKIKKIIELNGDRIEPEHHKQKNFSIIYEWNKPDELQKQRIVYNDKNLFYKKQTEIKLLKKQIKQVKKQFSKKMKIINKNVKETKFKKRDIKNLSLGRGINIIQKSQKAKDKKNKSMEEKNNLIKNIEEQIKKISNMNAFEYLRYKNGEDEGDENSISTKEEIEEKINNLEQLIKENKKIKYKKIKF